MTENNFVITERTVGFTRIFNAPRELVFRAYTDPSLIPRWWGPRRYTTTVDRMDVRQGGTWRFVQRGPDGEYAFNGTYKEIVEPRRLVDTFEFEGMPGHVLIETAVFEDLGSKTKVTGTALFQTDEDRDMMLNSGMEQGWAETMDRLAELLQELKDGAGAGREIVAERVFDAPREQVFDMWTDPERVARWWGPRGFTTTTYEMEVRPGGMWRFVMRGPDGTDYQNKIIYNEIARPERLVYSHVSGPLFQSTATFDEQGNKTRLTVRMLFQSAAERDKVARDYGAVDGSKQTLERLGERLAGR